MHLFGIFSSIGNVSFMQIILIDFVNNTTQLKYVISLRHTDLIVNLYECQITQLDHIRLINEMNSSIQHYNKSNAQIRHQLHNNSHLIKIRNRIGES